MNKIQYHFFAQNASVCDTVFGQGTAVRVKQVHSARCVRVSEVFTDANRPEADAVVTRERGLPIAVVTADCAPVLFVGDGGRVIGAAHAGWQGALSGVLEETIRQMDCDPKDIQAMIGPCIAQDDYEVSKGFETPFLDHNANALQFFKSCKKDDKYLFDVAGYCAFRLREAGVMDITMPAINTYRDESYASYRRACHTDASKKHGRNLSAIMINP